jgi:hypothetical protein
VPQPFEIQRWTGRVWEKVYLGRTAGSGSLTVGRLASGATVRVVLAARTGYLGAVTAGIRIN